MLIEGVLHCGFQTMLLGILLNQTERKRVKRTVLSSPPKLVQLQPKNLSSCLFYALCFCINFICQK